MSSRTLLTSRDRQAKWAGAARKFLLARIGLIAKKAHNLRFSLLLFGQTMHNQCVQAMVFMVFMVFGTSRYREANGGDPKRF